MKRVLEKMKAVWERDGGLRKGAKDLAVPPISIDLSLVDSMPTAGGVSSTAPVKGSLYLMRTKQKSKGCQ